MMNKYTHIAIQGWQREWSVDILSGSAMVGWLYTSTSLSMLVDKLRREEEGL